jgi:haloalkane dehalogenase
VLLVVHDWGSALGLNRAARLPEVQAIAYLEAIVALLRWENYGPGCSAPFARRKAKR